MTRLPLLALLVWLLAIGDARGGGNAPAVPGGTDRIEIFVDEYPPFLEHDRGEVRGVFREALLESLGKAGLAARLTPMPLRRGVALVEQRPGTCAFPVDYRAEWAEVVNFLARVSPMYFIAYARRGELPPLLDVTELNRYSVGSFDVGEIRLALDNAGVKYELVRQRTRAVDMLRAHRFDVLVADLTPLAKRPSGRQPLDVVFTLGRVDYWIVCHHRTPRGVVEALRRGLQHGLYSDSLEPVWEREGMGDLYRRVRGEWPPAGK